MKKNRFYTRWFKSFKALFPNTPKTQEELVQTLRIAQKESVIDMDTLSMLEGVLLLAKMRVRDIMLPKQQMICIPHDAANASVIDIVTNTGHSRFPVTGESKDEIIGILHAKDLLCIYEEIENHADTHSFDLPDLVRSATFIPEGQRLDSLLRTFRINRTHMAIVVDEYGATAGFVTLEDIIEQIVGDIEDEFDIDEESNIKVHSKDHYVLKGHTSITEFNETLKADFKDDSYDTIGGIVMATLGHLAKPGEIVRIESFEFKVLHADARRIKVLECYDRREQHIHDS